MYTNFFSLSELPFSIAPNPNYLFMSDRHRDALTHLSYGLGGSSLGDNGGFVLLTGEVGTGKTTVSRCLMADLPENTQLAFILNPTLSSQELLATICDQLKIRYRKTDATLKTLTDKISEKLLKNHANGINTLLIIDEAQHLEAEVLEQLRLLTNLETDTKKLLQVILIGQPELQQLLKRRDLRQLAQRITARYHLLPLDKQELALYIKHRLSVAGCHRALFNKSALAAIHKLSQGIPRLINLLCHSALMEAYNTNNAVVDKKIVLKAASHALGDDFEQVNWWQNKSSQLGIAASVLIAVLFAGFWLGQNEQSAQRVQSEQQEKLEQVSVNDSDTPNNIIHEPSLSINLTEQGIEQQVAQPKEALPQTNIQAKTVEQLVISGEKPVDNQNEHSKLTQSNTINPEPVVSKSTKTHITKTPTSITENKASNKVAKTQPVIKEKKINTQNENYQIEAVDGVSDDLLARFQAAIDETKNAQLDAEELVPTDEGKSNVKPLTQMPAWVQNELPNLRFEQHIYATDGQGWVNVNGRDRYEGDSIAQGVVLDEILPQQVILTYRGEKFSLPALTNW